MAQGGHGRRADAITRRGMMLVLSSPSGAGKTTLSRRLLASDPGITLSISVTTRPPRADEVDDLRAQVHDAAPQPSCALMLARSSLRCGASLARKSPP